MVFWDVMHVPGKTVHWKEENGIYMEGRTLTGVTSKSRMKEHFFIFFF